MAFASATERRLVVALVPLVAAASVFGAACSSGTSPAPATTTTDAGGDVSSDAPTDAAADVAPSCALPGRFGSAKCGTCVTEQCCVRLDACARDPDCAILSSCTLACIDQPDAGGCATACRAKTRDPEGRWAALEKCAYFADPCAFECSVSAR